MNADVIYSCTYSVLFVPRFELGFVKIVQEVSGTDPQGVRKLRYCVDCIVNNTNK